ncbi:hypothetical protein KJ707_01060 [Patescibacteria group bacterium]|nr:hypothetical protein [Patescibacteria group bacterium]
MEDKLQILVKKIKASDKLKSDEKDYLYKILHDSIAGLVWPVLVRYMDHTELKKLADNPQKVTVEKYQSLLQKALDDGQVLVEMNQMMEKIIDETAQLLESKLN